MIRSVVLIKRVVYLIMRLRDIKILYEKMLENNVEFGLLDKCVGGFFNFGLVWIDGNLFVL